VGRRLEGWVLVECYQPLGSLLKRDAVKGPIDQQLHASKALSTGFLENTSDRLYWWSPPMMLYPTQGEMLAAVKRRSKAKSSLQ
jgi:hypothetical protein